MGTWGTAIFSDDVACDVRDGYKAILRKGIDEPEATEQMIKNFKGEIDDFDDGPVFWLALASVQWQHGRLQNKVKKKALEIIKKGSDLPKWEEDPKDLEKRKAVLEKLKEKITSPQPPPKKIPKKREYKWKPMPPDEIDYPFVPKSSKYLLPGQFWAIPLSDGSYVCGRIIRVNPTTRNEFIAGLMDWIGKQPPNEDDISDHKVILQIELDVKSIRETGGEIIGCRDLEKDGIEPWIFRPNIGLSARRKLHPLIKGYDDLKQVPFEEWRDYPVLIGGGHVYFKLVVEMFFVEERDNMEESVNSYYQGLKWHDPEPIPPPWYKKKSLQS